MTRLDGHSGRTWPGFARLVHLCIALKCVLVNGLSEGVSVVWFDCRVRAVLWAEVIAQVYLVLSFSKLSLSFFSLVYRRFALFFTV